MAKQMDRKTGRWKTWVLILSLGLNLFILASVAGRVIGAHGPYHRHWRAPDVGLGPFTEVLTRRDRAALRDAFLQAAPDFRDGRQEAAADFQRLADALRADTLDPAAVNAVIMAQTARSAERLDLGGRLLAERLGEMTAEDRRALAGRIEEALERRKR